MVNVVAFIQSRRTSKRFPGKIDADLCGRPVIRWVVDAANRIRGLRGVQVLQAEDYPQIPQDDVLTRYHAAWQAWEPRPDAIMRLTGDCPLLDPRVCELVLEAYLKDGSEYASNIWPTRTFPDGLDCEVFSAGMLQQAHAYATEPSDREHVTPWMQRTPRAKASITLPVDWSGVRLTLDEPRDLDWLRQVVEYHRSLGGSSSW